MLMKRPSNWSPVIPFIALLVTGCTPAEDPQVTKYRNNLLLREEPAGSVTIESARSEINSKTNVVLTGRIGTRELSQWWIDGSASFYVSEGMPDSHYNVGPDHDPSTCPFCRHKWKLHDSMAIVHLVDKSGERISIPATDLLDVEKDDIVVATGTASLDESGFLVIESTGLFVR